MVCRVFQKSTGLKKPQQTPSSHEPSIESPCDDTNSIVNNEFGDIELPNLNSIANSSTGFISNNNNISNFMNSNNINNNNNNNHFSNMMSLNNMNYWTSTTANSTASTLIPSLSSWPSNLLNPNLSMNSLLFKALQLRNGGTSLEHYSYMPQGISQFGTPDILSSTTTSNNFHLASSSSSKMNNNQNIIVDSASQVQQQEQQFNLDSIGEDHDHVLF